MENKNNKKAVKKNPAQSAKEIEAYWTKERLKNAKPLSINKDEEE